MKSLSSSRRTSGQRSRVIQPLGWLRPKGYANGIVAEGRMLFIAGQLGCDPKIARPKFPKGFGPQFEQALANVLQVLCEAGGRPSDLVRLTVYVVDKREYLSFHKKVGDAWRRHIGHHFPAMALVEVSALLEDEAKVEIEATAVL